jgi:hypothetical protein
VLYEFVTTYRNAIIARSKEKLTARPWPPASPTELDNGVPLFLTQLAEVLRDEEAGRAYAPSDIESGGVRHGRDLLASGFSISQVVHDYGDICQAVTELAVELHAPITTEEFHTLNRCLDTAIAEAVTEHARLTAHARYTDDAERSGHIAHETRDLLNTAILAFETLKRGTVAINGSTGAVLGRSLLSLRDLVNSTLSEIRVAADRSGASGFRRDVDRSHRSRRSPACRSAGVELHQRTCGWRIDDQRDPEPRVRGHQPVEQRLQIHATRRHRHPPRASRT